MILAFRNMKHPQDCLPLVYKVRLRSNNSLRRALVEVTKISDRVECRGAAGIVGAGDISDHSKLCGGDYKFYIHIKLTCNLVI